MTKAVESVCMENTKEVKEAQSKKSSFLLQDWIVTFLSFIQNTFPPFFIWLASSFPQNNWNTFEMLSSSLCHHLFQLFYIFCLSHSLEWKLHEGIDNLTMLTMELNVDSRCLYQKTLYHVMSFQAHLIPHTGFSQLPPSVMLMPHVGQYRTPSWPRTKAPARCNWPPS